MLSFASRSRRTGSPALHAPTPKPFRWSEALAENPLARFVPFSSLVSAHDVITRGVKRVSL